MFMSLGMRNTSDKVIEDQRIAQEARLTTTRPGTRILKSTGSATIALLDEIFVKQEVKEI
ncbi:hypothetical protein HPB50_014372 [Hyalomma asiaticum]|uniref:Uncharacterized protein n=1 Tax=Hyalomma asiaticum TaxID=266040 RepID=A0ACB7S9C3_HYAAI|nr:hypothetical protein HPB50_014372 [Hyalomma asiaticum]